MEIFAKIAGNFMGKPKREIEKHKINNGRKIGPWECSFFNEEELKNTEGRMARFKEEWTDKQNFKFTVFPNTTNLKDMIVLKDITFASLCSHHLLPFHGNAHIAYIPTTKICGISKLARAVDMFACKPQIQEKLTHDIANFLVKKLSPNIMVILEAKHDCITIRGIKKDSIMVTSAVRGEFNKKDVKEEALWIIKH